MCRGRPPSALITDFPPPPRVPSLRAQAEMLLQPFTVSQGELGGQLWCLNTRVHVPRPAPSLSKSVPGQKDPMFSPPAATAFVIQLN